MLKAAKQCCFAAFYAVSTAMAEWVGFEPTGDCSHDGFRVHAVMTTSVPLRIYFATGLLPAAKLFI